MGKDSQLSSGYTLKWDTKNILCSKVKTKHKHKTSKTGKLVMHAKTLSFCYLVALFIKEGGGNTTLRITGEVYLSILCIT